MAERRMFSKKVIDSDFFLDMPQTAQALYFHLAMRADDDGFVGNYKRIMRMIGANDDDYKVLRAKRFILEFDSGVIVITHWRVHNYIQNDRYNTTIYEQEFNAIDLQENKVYAMSAGCIQNVSTSETQVRLGKVRLDKDRIDKVRSLDDEPTKKKASSFLPPTVDDVRAYCTERKNTVDPERFVDHYTANGWHVGKTKMKDWKASVRTWEKNEFKAGGQNGKRGPARDPWDDPDYYKNGRL